MDFKPGFVGGKMRHVLTSSRPDDEVDGESKSYVGADGKSSWHPDFLSSGAVKALIDGNVRIFTKIDGSCGVVHSDFVFVPTKKTIYQRRDTSSPEVPPGMSELPSGGKNPVVYDGGKKMHNYYCIRLPRGTEDDSSGSKKMDKAYKDLYEKVDAFDFPDEWTSIELVGKNFNSTPGLGDKNGIAPHYMQRIILDLSSKGVSEDPNEWYAFFVDYFKEHNVEGLVFEWDGVWWKLLANVCSPLSLWSTSRKDADPPKII